MPSPPPIPCSRRVPSLPVRHVLSKPPPPLTLQLVSSLPRFRNLQLQRLHLWADVAELGSVALRHHDHREQAEAE